MLKIGTIIYVADNSGAESLKILNVKKITNISVSINVGDVVKGVIQDFNLHKKKILLKKKDRPWAIISSVKKKSNKRNGIFISFSHNKCIPVKITRFVLPYTTPLYTSTFYEITFIKKFKVISESVYHLF